MVRERRPRQDLPVDLPPTSSLGARRRLAMAAIRLYQRWIAPRLSRRCVLEPSCSRYAEFAIAYEGVAAGSVATWRRLHRCVPENEGCIDYPKGVAGAVSSGEHRPGLQ